MGQHHTNVKLPEPLKITMDCTHQPLAPLTTMLSTMHFKLLCAKRQCDLLVVLKIWHLQQVLHNTEVCWLLLNANRPNTMVLQKNTEPREEENADARERP